MLPRLQTLLLLFLFPATLHAEPPVELKLVGPWEVRVALPASASAGNVPAKPTATTLAVARPLRVTVQAERHDRLPLFNPKAGGWLKGSRLLALRASETTTPYLLIPQSLTLRAGPETDSAAFQLGTDYQADMDWETLGRLPSGSIQAEQPVYASYEYIPQRLDSIVCTPAGQLELRQGTPATTTPQPPPLVAGEQRLANLWIPGNLRQLTPDHLFPILEKAYPEPAKSSPTPAEKMLPKSLQKLRSGQPLRILAWGDSVTVGSYLPDPASQRWQAQMATRLQERFPKAKIELITEAWGGRNTGSYLAEPAGSEHNYREKVLAVKPDLIVSEFVNDAGLNPQQVEQRYSRLLTDFQKIGAEWIIFTPHYIRPDWMGISRERDIDDDPRPYVHGLRQFATRHQVPLAEASLRYGRLWRQGIPYTTLLVNSINHPNAHGMKLFADAFMELFP